jgi:hypothetical protein
MMGPKVTTDIQQGIVWVRDDVTSVPPTRQGPVTSLDAIQWQCFNIQQALWWGLLSTINPDGNWTFRKSDFAEVDISFLDAHEGANPFASCRLTSTREDQIDKAGMWDDGDYTGAWSLYDSTTFQ